MAYRDFTTHDFIEDARFRRWVRQPDAETEAFWREFLAQYPEKRPEVIAATNFLLSIEQQVESGAAAAHEEMVFQNIRQDLEEAPRTPIGRQLFRWAAWAAAASLLLMAGYFILAPGSRQNQEVSYETNRKQTTLALTERVNDASTPLSISLADGSRVSLLPGSRISYAGAFGTDNKREVYLSGEAFFDVTKDPTRPFYVYANELVTKVLGTSFDVRAYQNDEDVTVKVRTGRVSVAVADRVGGGAKISLREREGILLLPNQQAVLARKDVRLVKTLVSEPILLSETVPNQPKYSFVFEAAPASTVFKTLALAYGLDIVFDEETFTNCQFTADLTGVPHYEKLDIICRSIEASYRILDAQIIVDGQGCHP